MHHTAFHQVLSGVDAHGRTGAGMDTADVSHGNGKLPADWLLMSYNVSLGTSYQVCSCDRQLPQANTPDFYMPPYFALPWSCTAGVQQVLLLFVSVLPCSASAMILISAHQHALSFPRRARR